MLVHVQVYFYNTILMGDSRLAMEWFISGLWRYIQLLSVRS